MIIISISIISIISIIIISSIIIIVIFIIIINIPKGLIWFTTLMIILFQQT